MTSRVAEVTAEETTTFFTSSNLHVLVDEQFDEEGVEAGDHGRFVGGEHPRVDAAEDQHRQQQGPDALAQGLQQISLQGRFAAAVSKSRLLAVDVGVERHGQTMIRIPGMKPVRNSASSASLVTMA